MTTIFRQQDVKIVVATRCGRECGTQQPGAGQRCYYCNSLLKCGQQCCIWREVAPDPVDLAGLC